MVMRRMRMADGTRAGGPLRARSTAARWTAARWRARTVAVPLPATPDRARVVAYSLESSAGGRVRREVAARRECEGADGPGAPVLK